MGELKAKKSREDQTIVSSTRYHQSSCTPVIAGSRTVMQNKHRNPRRNNLQSTQTGDNQIQYYVQEFLHDRSGHTFTHPVLQ
jgi:hypothetical protein